MFKNQEWIINALLVLAWAYVAFYMIPSALYLFIKTGGFWCTNMKNMYGMNTMLKGFSYAEYAMDA